MPQQIVTEATGGITPPLLLLAIPCLIFPMLVLAEADGTSGAVFDGWGTPPCAGVALDSFESCPESLIGATTCCGLGVCASTGLFQCTSGLLENTCVPGEPLSNQDVSCDGIDQDCSGEADEDFTAEATNCGIGACASSGLLTCQNGQTSDSCTPGIPSPEACNSIDDDCDGTVDEGNPGGGLSCDTGQPGACAAGSTQCQGGALFCEALNTPSAEVCNGIDDDCDASVDEGNPGGGLSCDTGQPGACAAGSTQCQGGALFCEALNTPSAEVCNGIDDDCDGAIDEGNPGGGAACNTGQLGVCAAGTTVCQGGALSCAADVSPSPEVCDNLDNDCDGVVDEGC